MKLLQLFIRTVFKTRNFCKFLFSVYNNEKYYTTMAAVGYTVKNKYTDTMLKNMKLLQLLTRTVLKTRNVCKCLMFML